MRLTAALPLLAALCAGGVLFPEAAWADDNVANRPYSAFRSAAVLRAAADVDTRTKALRRTLFKTSVTRALVTLPESEPADAPAAAPRSDASFARELSLQPTSFTPYDRYLGTVRAVIAHLDPREPGMVKACALVREGRRFRYHATDPYRAAPPALTAARHEGDCKAKALWLYDQLGDPEAFYVIGKLERRSRTSHAWVYWRCQDRWWILDPTARSAPIAADSVSSQRYVPYYSFGKEGTYRHPATRLLLAQSSGPVAAGTTDPEPHGKRQIRR